VIDASSPERAAAARAEAASRAARAAQPAWAARDPAERGRVLARAARLLVEETEALPAILGERSGRPAVELWSGEILPTLDALRWLVRDGARELRPRALRRSGLQWYVRATRHELVWEPHGVVAVVTPGSGLLFLGVTQIAGALLAGNAVIWKPSPPGAPVAEATSALFARAGLPSGLLELVTGGPEAARAVIDAGVDKLFFTGGSEAGRALYARQAARGRPAVLELSGRHAAVVLDGADLGLTARGIAFGKLANGGRHCVSVQLVLVERAAAAGLLEAIQAVLRSLRAEATEAVDPGERARLEALVADAVAHGARRLTGEDGGVTLLGDVAPGMRVVEEEVRGPILAVAAVASVDEAVAWVNRSPFRLSASLWAADTGRARRLAGRLDVGQVWINDALHPTGQPAVTLAGRGASGFGASRGLAGLLEMVQPKVVSETPLRAPRRHYLPSPAGTADLFRATARLVAGDPGRRRVALRALLHALMRLARGR
jgi:acyl-CoA reductase-like NAD-dependent aldehyde dehydrogenase